MKMKKKNRHLDISRHKISYFYARLAFLHNIYLNKENKNIRRDNA